MSDVFDEKIAERLKNAILNSGGYEVISEKTQISVSTLKRTANYKTEPKFSTVAIIAKETCKNLSYIAYGTGPEDATVTIDGENRLTARIDHIEQELKIQKERYETLKARIDKVDNQ
ncbi:hypothetical protein [Vibrio scophthalmi]|uniref:HTH cro/C1-type domain-containing protein n=1 Tax=Vibrio scophthalmi TaxID=45658 RepID=A0A1E3WG01_9VIBR|nr:hypothetical protein [Vibrio scophthalmi]ODS04726.1 hypothetical protein VSF3289_03865 [Vibrio scophthalmi]ODS04734.1 hypothetical protein VSF3289_03873 [Vibrio scophthalmi]